MVFDSFDCDHTLSLVLVLLSKANFFVCGNDLFGIELNKTFLVKLIILHILIRM